MWYRLGRFILKYRASLLVLLLVLTAVMGWFAARVQLNYDFTRAVPDDNKKYVEYQAFLKKFGGDAGAMVIGIQTDSFYSPHIFNEVAVLHDRLKKLRFVEGVLSVPGVLVLRADTVRQRFVPEPAFHPPYTTQAALDSTRAQFEKFLFYRGILYSNTGGANSYLVAVTLNRARVNSAARTQLVASVMNEVNRFETATGLPVRVSGLPYIRTVVGDRLKHEMQWFLLGALLLLSVTLLLFFRSWSAVAMSLLVVGMGVVWSMGTMVLCGYKITLLTALIPTLIVVIGIPNCIYFLNKYHTSFATSGNKKEALVNMVGRMGIVTLFCNIAAAIGFAVFAFTNSALLKEFGVVSGINIMALFFISLLFIPAVLSYLPAPSRRQVSYLESPLLVKMLSTVEIWALRHSKWVYLVTGILTAGAVAGIFRIHSEAFIVDDLPKQDRVYTDMKWFEQQFGGVMPLEIVVDTRKKNGLFRSVRPMQKVDELETFIASQPGTARPLSFVDGLKFARQAYYDGDSLAYTAPTESDLVFLGPFLQTRKDSASKNTALAQLLSSFMDSSKQAARISVNMKDIGTQKLPAFLKQIEDKSARVFDSSYRVTFTGASVTFLEGSSFIIAGLKASIFWAFILIALCMLFLFRSFRILICSLIPNIIPLVLTAGVMGWAGVPLKPSTVLVFSVALGIVIDVTIRFLVNYNQELPDKNGAIEGTLVETIRHTGISIIYTSLVLISGFVIFCFSSFGGTFALGWLTSLTLVTGTFTNLVLLPVLILSFFGKKKPRS